MPNNLTTEAGRSKPQAGSSEQLIDAINQVFGLLRINFHNQYHAAFADASLERSAKRLWLETLQRFSPEVILRAAKRVIEESEYLPTLHKMIGLCEGIAHHLPDARTAFVEACRKPSPKAEQDWSHPIVYHAGKASDWFFLSSEPEYRTFPVFERHYKKFCALLAEGAALEMPQLKRLPKETAVAADAKTGRRELEKLKKDLGM